MQSGNQRVFKHRKISLTAVEKLEGTPKNDKIICTSGNDSITGHKGTDTLRGRQGDDILNGNNGNDRLKGGKDNDILNGGKGNNTLHGGNGRDTFIIGQGRDLIKDFNIKKKILLKHQILITLLSMMDKIAESLSQCLDQTPKKWQQLLA